jgi:transposase
MTRKYNNPPSSCIGKEAQIDTMLAQGLSARKVSTILGLRKNTVFAYMRAKNMPTSSGRTRRLLEGRKNEIISRYRSGEKQASIAERVGVSPSTLYLFLKDMGITRATERLPVGHFRIGKLTAEYRRMLTVLAHDLEHESLADAALDLLLEIIADEYEKLVTRETAGETKNKS